MEYLVIIEGEPGNYSAYVPDLPGCITVGESQTEIETNIHEAIEAYLSESERRGLPKPKPSTFAVRVSIAA